MNNLWSNIFYAQCTNAHPAMTYKLARPASLNRVSFGRLLRWLPQNNNDIEELWMVSFGLLLISSFINVYFQWLIKVMRGVDKWGHSCVLYGPRGVNNATICWEKKWSRKTLLWPLFGEDNVNFQKSKMRLFWAFLLLLAWVGEAPISSVEATITLALDATQVAIGVKRNDKNWFFQLALASGLLGRQRAGAGFPCACFLKRYACG